MGLTETEGHTTLQPEPAAGAPLLLWEPAWEMPWWRWLREFAGMHEHREEGEAGQSWASGVTHVSLHVPVILVSPLPVPRWSPGCWRAA